MNHFDPLAPTGAPSMRQVQIGTHRAKVTLGPFEPGFGHTIGNSLRRVLLSSMVGHAAIEVSIAGVLHEYASIDGIREDVLGILSNLKGIVFRLRRRSEVTLRLGRNTEGPILAGDIQVPHDVDIINPHHVIANLSQGGELYMQIKVVSGRGYAPATARRAVGEPNPMWGRIALDASFSPIKHVSYAVERVHPEQRTGLENLLIDIETNGAITAEEAIQASARILAEQLAVFRNLEGGESRAVEALDPIMSLPIEKLDLGRRSANLLRAENLCRIGDLVHRTEHDLLKAPNMGRKSLDEIKEVLARRGLRLGMKLRGWPPVGLEQTLSAR